MTPILDDLEDRRKPAKTFSKLSFVISIISLILVGYLGRLIPSKIKASEGFSEPPMILLLTVYVFVLAGLASIVLSFSRKEPSNWMKWIGGLLNSMLFLIVFGSMIFAKLIDASR